MMTHRSHAAKHHTGKNSFQGSAHGDSKEEKEADMPFMAWPFFLFEKLSKPWRHAVSPISWVDSWQVGDRLTVPKTLTSETEQEYLYQIELPEIKRDQIVLNFHNGSIMLRVVQTDRSRSKRAQEKSLHVIRRAFSLPVYTDGEAITAKLKNGILSIVIPKTDMPVAPKARSIHIT